MNNFKSAAWTGRAPRLQFPDFDLSIRCRWFYFCVGPIDYGRGYGVELRWKRNPVRGPGCLVFLNNHHLLWWTEQQLTEARLAVRQPRHT